MREAHVAPLPTYAFRSSPSGRRCSGKIPAGTDAASQFLSHWQVPDVTISPKTRLFYTHAAVAMLLASAAQVAMAGQPAPQSATSAWPAIQSPYRPDAALEARISAIVSGMTLEQKIGQMTQADIRSITPDQVRRFYIGSVLNGGGAWPLDSDRATVADWVALSDRFYRASMMTDMKVQVPVIWGTDAVHGHNNVYGATLFPHNVGLGAAHDPALMERIGRMTARAVRATGITWAFAPTLAVVENTRWGRSYESYSSDPALVRDYGDRFVRGLQGNLTGKEDVIASAKHFLGDGGTWLGKDQGETRTPEANLIAMHAQGYFSSLAAGVQTVMVSYSSWADTATGRAHGKMHGNRHLVTDVLKNRMGFDGIVVSDWNAIEQVPGCARAHCPQAINAGIDMVMVPDDWQEFIKATVADVQAGTIPLSRIDDAVTRILRVKLRTGLFDASPADATNRPADAAVGGAPIKALARQAASQSLVLLKNRKGLLPLLPGKRLLVVGKGAADMSRQTGGWSLTWQGTETGTPDFPNGDTLLAAIRAAAGAGQVDYSETGTDRDVAGYDAIIAVVSEAPYAEMKGDILYPASLAHSARYPADLAMLDAVSGKGVPVATIMFSGRPVYANDLINRSDAFVAAWLPGTEGKGVTDVLFLDSSGKAKDFTGRLSFDWPSSTCPEVSKARPAFARGFGLTYRHRGATPQLKETDAVGTCPAIGK